MVDCWVERMGLRNLLGSCKDGCVEGWLDGRELGWLEGLLDGWLTGPRGCDDGAASSILDLRRRILGPPPRVAPFRRTKGPPRNLMVPYPMKMPSSSESPPPPPSRR